MIGFTGVKATERAPTEDAESGAVSAFGRAAPAKSAAASEPLEGGVQCSARSMDFRDDDCAGSRRRDRRGGARRNPRQPPGPGRRRGGLQWRRVADRRRRRDP